MSDLRQRLQAHLASGATTTVPMLGADPADGVVMGFTDHDRPISRSTG